MPTNTKYVLVPDDTWAVSPSDAARQVQLDGIAAVAARFGVSESTLRRFLSDAGWKAVRTQTWVQNGQKYSEEVVTGGGEEDDVVDPSRPG